MDNYSVQRFRALPRELQVMILRRAGYFRNYARQRIVRRSIRRLNYNRSYGGAAAARRGALGFLPRR